MLMPSTLASAPQELRWRCAIEAGLFGVWDLNPVLDIVHYSPQWKVQLGFPQVFASDSTSFWRCRVHPADREAMLAALRAHVDGYTPTYEMQFRLRSNGSGYRTVLSRGRVVERDHRGNAARMIGTMIDLTGSAATPASVGLAFTTAAEAPAPDTARPFHESLGVAGGAVSAPCDEGGQRLADDKARYLGALGDLLDLALREASLR